MENFPNLDLADLGEELHFAQETNPYYFADIIMYWYQKINSDNAQYLQFINKKLHNHA
jgi:hypothetical protein